MHTVRISVDISPCKRTSDDTFDLESDRGDGSDEPDPTPPPEIGMLPPRRSITRRNSADARECTVESAVSKVLSEERSAHE